MQPRGGAQLHISSNIFLLFLQHPSAHPYNTNGRIISDAPTKRRLFDNSSSARAPRSALSMSPSSSRMGRRRNQNKGLTSGNVPECPEMSHFEKSFSLASKPQTPPHNALQI